MSLFMSNNWKKQCCSSTEAEQNKIIHLKGPVNIICTLMKYEETFKSTKIELKTSLTEDKYEILSANLRKSPIPFQSLASVIPQTCVKMCFHFT